MEFGTFSRLGITGLVRVVWVTHRSAEEKGDGDRVQEEKSEARETQRIRDFRIMPRVLETFWR